MVQTIEQIEDFHRSIQTVEQKLSETSKLMMLLLETPGDLPADFVRLLAKTLELKIDMTSGVKEENFRQNNDIYSNEIMKKNFDDTKTEEESTLEEQNCLDDTRDNISIQNEILLARKEEWQSHAKGDENVELESTVEYEVVDYGAIQSQEMEELSYVVKIEENVTDVLQLDVKPQEVNLSLKKKRKILNDEEAKKQYVVHDKIDGGIEEHTQKYSEFIEDENVVAIENKVVLERRNEWPTNIEPDKKIKEETGVLEVDLPPLKKKKKKDNGAKARRGYCEDCKRHYAVIKEHRRTVHDKISKTWKCPLCDIIIEYIHFSTCFNHKQECEARVTGIVDRYSCPGCDEKFPTVKLREQHKLVCLPKQGLVPKIVQTKTCICTYEGCDYKSHKRQNLKNHINKVHLNVPIERNHYCDFCGKNFSYKNSLDLHVVKHHTNRKDFACNICDSKFSTRNDWRQHMEIHSDVKKYVCPFCGKGFKQGSVLYRHKLSCKSNPEK